jgi:DivIVA domain-containing protein
MNGRNRTAKAPQSTKSTKSSQPTKSKKHKNPKKAKKSRPRIRRRLRGYRRAQVDSVLARVAGTLGTAQPTGPPITAEEARAIRFGVQLRGYDRRIVDELFAERIRELEAHDNVGGYSARHARTRAPARFSPVSADWLVSWITTAQFGVVRVRPGYDERDVDAFLARVVAGLQGDAPPVSARDVRESRFRTVRFGAGYQEREVDRFLDQLASALEGLSKG